ncbi:hypothetical protein ZHAS_00006701 [Anopheles sinensis]|uniref:Uncharacterized protein n=1 Tax=Anopheles sinensis TaxID=74873 RepID=A0A084VM01_ANOSI|nr:hypothetical protein ZHAS_00006701 [Anopheles sinensis]
MKITIFALLLALASCKSIPVQMGGQESQSAPPTSKIDVTPPAAGAIATKRTEPATSLTESNLESEHREAEPSGPFEWPKIGITIDPIGMIVSALGLDGDSEDENAEENEFLRSYERELAEAYGPFKWSSIGKILPKLKVSLDPVGLLNTAIGLLGGGGDENAVENEFLRSYERELAEAYGPFKWSSIGKILSKPRVKVSLDPVGLLNTAIGLLGGGGDENAVENETGTWRSYEVEIPEERGSFKFPKFKIKPKLDININSIVSAVSSLFTSNNETERAEHSNGNGYRTIIIVGETRGKDATSSSESSERSSKTTTAADKSMPSSSNTAPKTSEARATATVVATKATETAPKSSESRSSEMTSKSTATASKATATISENRATKPVMPTSVKG